MDIRDARSSTASATPPVFARAADPPRVFLTTFELDDTV